MAPQGRGREALTSTVMVPWSGPMVCSVSLSSSFLYSHSTPMAMKDLELGSKWFSSFKMNLPVSRFLTAENGKRKGEGGTVTTT